MVFKSPLGSFVSRRKYFTALAVFAGKGTAITSVVARLSESRMKKCMMLIHIFLNMKRRKLVKVVEQRLQLQKAYLLLKVVMKPPTTKKRMMMMRRMEIRTLLEMLNQGASQR